MEIISISLDSETLKELNSIQEKLGYKSRSKMLRSTINALLNEYKALDKITGVHEAVFVMTYKERERNHISAILHEFEKIIKVTVHQHHGTLCLDMLNVDADAEMIRRLFGALRRSRCVSSINFALLGSSA
ncbi:MAG: ribbon-helix-helix protein, CopG family [Candidatus Micrarchaeota archaeon]|nr:ribbon-helix-helix protein, CopG family [Candidatus Micrarchaeota archaeon]